MMKKTHARGFTLVELLGVIAIIGILAASVIAAVGTTRAKARDASRIAELKEVQSALTLYSESHGGYPSSTPSGYVGNDAALQYLAASESGAYLSSVIMETGGGPSSFVYLGKKDDGTECTDPGDSCTGYVVGVPLERDNAVLGSDVDAALGTFDGASADCIGGAGGEMCLDRAE